MSTFEKVLMAILAAGKIVGPVFVHSNQGVAILNASEEFISVLPSIMNPPATPPAGAAQ